MSRLALAVDLGGTDLRTAVVDETGAILAFATTPTDSHGGPDAVVAQIVDLASRVRADAGQPVIFGIGVCAPGPLDPATGIVLSAPTLYGWGNVPLGALLQDRLGQPVVLENDANAAALGEWRFGAGRGTQDMVYITVSTGIGGGVIAGGRLLHGRRGLAGEIGHMTIDVRSPKTLFGGSSGVWEAMASGTALGQEATRRAKGQDGAAMRSLAGGPTITARHVVAAARQGDKLALSLMEEEARLLGIGFVNLMHLYSPERLIVGGGLSAALDLMQDEIAVTIFDRALPAYRDVPIVVAALSGHAGLVGAASLVF